MKAATLYAGMMTLTDGAAFSHCTPIEAPAVESSGRKFCIVDVVIERSIFYMTEHVNSPPHFFE